LFAVAFLGLMYLGLQEPQGIYVTFSRVFIAVYFGFFLLMPIYSRMDRVKPLPDRVTYHA
jgi:ubiquinol-cytochrome c reductase cytochrome b subunit